jgi:murein DD-endopeptidase MepM/ murein hydrolase activator NlpD
MESSRKNALGPAVIPRDHRQFAKALSKANHSAGLKSSRLDTSTSARTYPPDVRTHTSKAPSSGIKLAASYNYDLPDCMKNTNKTPLELLASGVVLSSIKTPWEKYTAKKPAYHDHPPKPSEDLFLKAPLKYSHVSSGFTYCRTNPISNSPRPHLGVDYAAPAGTPVHSIGPGRVIFHGWERGYGKTIRIRHRNGFISHYAHLSRFARDIMTGKMVKRGETIGYVGMTGLATGPHLDFRVTYLGMYINPVNLESRSKKLSSKNTPRKIRGSSRG